MLYETFEKIFALEAQGLKITKLNVGEPDWRPPASAIKAARNALAKGVDNYGSSYGEVSLREKLAQLHGCSAKNIAVTPGSKWCIYALLKLHLSPGDNAVIFSPYWSAYSLMCKSLGADARLVNLQMENGWKPDMESFNSAIDGKTKLIVLNSPCNPTSSAFSERDEAQITEIASERGITVLADDAYRDLLFAKRKERQFSDGVLGACTFSKTFGMTGWRIGYTVVPEEIAKKLVSLNQITFTNVPLFVQAGAQKALEGKEKFAAKVRKLCVQRASIAAKKLKNHFEFSEPEAGFYLFPKLPDGVNTQAFLDKMLDAGFAMVPGGAFGDYSQHFRVSLCREKEILSEACERMVETIDQVK